MAEKITTPKYYYGLGRRKTAIARVYLYEGKGESTINGKNIKDLIKQKSSLEKMNSPFKAIESKGEYYFSAKTSGGGVLGQIDAIRLGIARALLQVNVDFKKPLKTLKLLTRDSRMVESKKAGFRKARKKQQYSKR